MNRLKRTFCQFLESWGMQLQGSDDPEPLPNPKRRKTSKKLTKLSQLRQDTEQIELSDHEVEDIDLEETDVQNLELTTQPTVSLSSNSGNGSSITNHEVTKTMKSQPKSNDISTTDNAKTKQLQSQKELNNTRQSRFS